MSNKSYYYVSSNTSKGYVNFVATNVSNMKTVIILNHSSHILKTKILRKVISDLELTNHLEIICSPFGASFIDGVIVREKSLAIITDAIADTRLEKAIEIDLTSLFPSDFKHENLAEVRMNVKRLREKAYDLFAKGLAIHDELEDIYIKEMNFNKADEIAEKFIEEILKNIPKQQGKPIVKKRFFGTNTAEGAVNIVPEIIGNLSKRVYVKGRAGTGKSVFMKKVAQACKSHGFNIEAYHCSFDPNSIDMILVPELDFCLFDSTDPHEFFPEKTADIIVDLYEQTVTPGTDEKYAQEISKLTTEYKQQLKEGMAQLKQAKFYQDQLDFMHEIIDPDKIDQVKNKIMNHM